VLAAILATAVPACHHPLHPEPIALGPARELLIRVFINDTPLMMQLDTGASTTSITPATRARLGVEQFRQTEGVGAGGKLAKAGWVWLKSTGLAGDNLAMQFATVVDLDNAGGRIAGVLGMDMLGQYVLDVDLRIHRLTLHREGEPAMQSPDMVGVDYTPLPGGQIALAIAIDGHPATAILDLGANRTFANGHTALVPDDEAGTMSAAVGADRHRIEFRATGAVEVRFGTLALHAPSVWLGELPAFQTFGLAGRPAVLLGTDALAGRRIVIDPFAHRVYLSP